jgi:hypothetical protein
MSYIDTGKPLALTAFAKRPAQMFVSLAEKSLLNS